MESVLTSFGLKKHSATVELFGNGLINHTWKVTTPETDYILQKVNHQVFQNPDDIAQNTRMLEQYLKKHHPNYFFTAPIVSRFGSELVYVEGEGFYRMFPFIAGSHSIDVVETPEQAREAAVQFGRFTNLLSGFDVNRLHITIPHFHDLSLRFNQFLAAAENGNSKRIARSKDLIRELLDQQHIVEVYQQIKTNPAFRLRVTHHDTKISNVLLNDEDQGICVIDLDTVMPGYFISDVGDMMRTYLSPASEEETDFSKIEVRDEMFQAVAEGYYSEMQNELTEAELKHFVYAGKFLIYMQALRFLTDYLNNDVYYGSRYEGHNYNRAKNQAVLLQQLSEKEAALQAQLNF